jgi:hypothetical protein
LLKWPSIAWIEGELTKEVHQQVQAARPMHLVLVGAVAELAALADEESAARAVDGFTIVESALLPMPKLWIQQEFEDEDSLLQLSEGAR